MCGGGIRGVLKLMDLFQYDIVCVTCPVNIVSIFDSVYI